MISKYKDYLEKKLVSAGIKRKVYRSMKELKASGAVHIGAVLFEDEKFQKDGSKKMYTLENGTKVKRIKKLTRKTQMTVIIGDYSEEKCEAIFSEFLKGIGAGIDDGNGNYVEINILKSYWVDEKDSILKSKIAVQILIEFIGGVYVDVPFVKINEIEITGTEIGT
ncbi:hypothetical protein [Maledivibacter halophilus]|uniref:SON protein n=1 Tax=Maledivibacter halophilus TaxID=36842 RepID=A0A1T5L708_9FIRM|nr:hypothetical protein [Maledivibacter halophilus]SKC68289.1 hypothetical protein SAMN02194393_02137 [Maledivibacter halophilus]SKC71723.1 hypothetical protein SAMN02194393_02515 [Maledivibacter halophilus]SKC80176.1 hypothetical protein SAMN02194393_03448 [Maledivibacter halophilus]